jgi:hypothetical protein
MPGGADTGGVYVPGYYFVVSAANATAGAVYTDGTYNFTVVATISGGTTLQTTGTNAPVASSGTLTYVSGTGDPSITYSAYTVYLPITLTPGAGSQTQVMNINIGGIDIAGDGNTPFFYNDTNGNGGSTFQILTFYGAGITGTATITSAATASTQVAFYNNSFYYDPNNIGMTINDAAVQAYSGTALLSPITINAVNNNSNLSAYAAIIDGNVTINATGATLGVANFFDSQAEFINVTVNGSNAYLRGDGVSLPNIGNVTFTGGAVIGSNLRLVSYGTQINNDSNWSGQSVTDAFNSIYAIVQPITNGVYIPGNLSIEGNGQDGGGFNITGQSGTLNFDVNGQTWLNFNQGNSVLQIAAQVQFSPGTNGSGVDFGQQVLTSINQIQTATSTPPTPGVGSNAGSGAGATIAGGSTNLAGNVNVTAGTGATAGQLVTVTYGVAFPNASWVVITPTDPNSAALGLWVTTTAAGFAINTAGVPTPSTSYAFNYIVMGF